MLRILRPGPELVREFVSTQRERPYTYEPVGCTKDERQTEGYAIDADRDRHDRRGARAHLGLWWLNATRIVYTIDEPRRFGFAYGTLPRHAEKGEERFLVEHLDDDTVWYDVLAYSRPRHILARIGYPLARRYQKRFGRESKASMASFVGG